MPRTPRPFDRKSPLSAVDQFLNCVARLLARRWREEQRSAATQLDKRRTRRGVKPRKRHVRDQ